MIAIVRECTDCSFFCILHTIENKLKLSIFEIFEWGKLIEVKRFINSFVSLMRWKVIPSNST